MAWRPHEKLIEGELDNTVLGKVAGCLRFVGMKGVVRLNLVGNFHRDIRGAKIRLSGVARDDEKAARYMEGFSPIQTGEVGDITAGLPPQDYADYPYIEWYSEENGRVVLELEPEQVVVIGRPIPAIESDPISRQKQQQNMAKFLAGLSQSAQVPAVALGEQPVISDPKYTHWVIEGGRIIEEARPVEPGHNGVSFAYVRLFAMPEMAEYGSIEAEKLRSKTSIPQV